jgi:hypothetical protein
MVDSGSGWTSTGYRPPPGTGTNAFALGYDFFCYCLRRPEVRLERRLQLRREFVEVDPLVLDFSPQPICTAKCLDRPGGKIKRE